MVGQEGVQILEAGQVPAGALGQAEPVLLSRKLGRGPAVYGNRRSAGCAAGR